MSQYYELIDNILSKSNINIRELEKNNGSMYCVCYSDSNDKRLLLQHGLFLSENSCNHYINYNIECKKKDLLFAEPIPINNKYNNLNEIGAILQLVDTKLYNYVQDLEQIVRYEILTYITQLRLMNKNLAEIMNELKIKYYLKEEYIIELMGQDVFEELLAIL